MAADWSELPEDLSLLVLEKLPVLEFIRFGAVCTSWRSVQKSKKDCAASLGLPWMMLCDDDHENQTRGFFSITEGKTHRLVLPEIIGKRCCGSSHGWLMTIDRKANMNLLHPLSRTQIPLPHPPPPGEELPDDYNYEPGFLQCISVNKAVLSADPYVSPEDCVVMSIYGHIGKLAFCRLSDKSWTLVSQYPFLRFLDVCYYQGKFYGVDCGGKTVVCHIDDRNNPHVTYLLRRGDPHKTGTRYLVESMGDLLHVVRILGGFTDEEDNFRYTTKGFEVYKLDSKGTTWERVESLGDRALFIGYNHGISVSSSANDYYHPMCKNNAIYFTDNHDTDTYHDDGMSPGCEDHGVYNLSDGSFESFFPRSVTHPKLSPPIWCTPSIINS
ncbi:hypothetical protein QJS10_CPB18g01512 [Acorus calamus]|uniref:F-box domain-containing protein n=1 Tax=Acorus calamus TaxID=4465 RepID=A0AAV9CPL2_ACOCL|nr:hypothetical protein QJS10_CPB18g01512 [Acorus calamus]